MANLLTTRFLLAVLLQLLLLTASLKAPKPANKKVKPPKASRAPRNNHPECNLTNPVRLLALPAITEDQQRIRVDTMATFLNMGAGGSAFHDAQFLYTREEQMLKLMPKNLMVAMQTCMPEKWSKKALKKIAQWGSWQTMWDYAAHQETNTFLLEDDAKLADDFCHLANKLQESLPPADQWDIAFTGHCLEQFDQTHCQKVEGEALYFARSMHPQCIHGVLVNPSGAKRIHKAMSNFVETFFTFIRSSPWWQVENAQECWAKFGLEKPTLGIRNMTRHGVPEVPHFRGENETSLLQLDLESALGHCDSDLMAFVKSGQIKGLTVTPSIIYQQHQSKKYTNLIPEKCEMKPW